MKKVLLIIVSLLSVLCLSASPVHVSAAMKFSSTYRGMGYSRRAYAAHLHSTAENATPAIVGQAPVASMSSTAFYKVPEVSYGQVRETASTGIKVGGVYTAASSIRGGVTTEDSCPLNRSTGRRKSNEWHGNPSGAPDCGCHWIEIDDGIWQCEKCGAIWDEYDDTSNCHTHCGGECHCDVPLDMDEAVMLFFVAMAAAYGAYKKRTLILQ